MARVLKMLSARSRRLLARLGELDRTLREALWAFDEAEKDILLELAAQSQREPDLKGVIGRRLLTLEKPITERVAQVWRPARVRKK